MLIMNNDDVMCIQELIEKHEKSVADHVSYADSHRKACDWLTGSEQRLAKAAADGGDTAEAVRRQLGLVRVSTLLCVKINSALQIHCITSRYAKLIISLC